ncbi:MAG: enoyl-CoA hydratase/isomerase family protein [Burkholderiales bacterium]|nr:enoyl-CoA hydratase/isomerase family protein [Burkholderiales bacterium]
MAADSPVLIESRDGVALLSLNRPAALNAVDAGLRAALIAALHTLAADPEVKAAVIAGAGERAYCAGQDLREALNLSVEQVEGWLERQHAMYQSVRDFDKPLVAALNGVAAGAGFQIALCCDLRVGYPKLRIGQPEIRAGLASIVGSYLMSLQLPLSLNQQLSLSGELLTGQRAHDLGLVNHLAPQAQVKERAVALAQELAEMPAAAYAATKSRLRELSQPGFDAALLAAKRAQAALYASGEPQRVMRAFFARGKDAA